MISGVADSTARPERGSSRLNSFIQLYTVLNDGADGSSVTLTLSNS